MTALPTFYGKPIDTPTGHTWGGHRAPEIVMVDITAAELRKGDRVQYLDDNGKRKESPVDDIDPMVHGEHTILAVELEDRHYFETWPTTAMVVGRYDA